MSEPLRVVSIGGGHGLSALLEGLKKYTQGPDRSGGHNIDITAIGTPTPAAEAFIAYTLSPAGLAQYKAGGFTLLTPTVVGDKSAVPASVTSELSSS